jgi:hypothetical protein
MGALIGSLLIRYRMIVVTNRRILVLDTGNPPPGNIPPPQTI